MKTVKTKKAADFLLAELDTAAVVAHQYGFTPLVSPKITADDKTKVKQLKGIDRRSGETEERLALIRLFHDGAFNRIAQPPMIFTKRPFPGSDSRKKAALETCGLDIINASSAAADALVIRAALAILEDTGVTNLQLEINSIGDKDSFARFERELHSYLKKNTATFPAELKQRFRDNIMEIVSCQDAECQTACINTPRSLSYLSEPSRTHFKEVLEFLEMSGIGYQINPTLLPNTAYGSHTVFEIRGCLPKSKDATTILASGGRYNNLSKKAGHKKDVAACGVYIHYPKKTTDKPKLADKIKPAKFYLIQLGNMARLQTLNIIELLRRENIRVHHSLTKDNIGAQIASAEYLKVSHLLIIGQKEAIEQSIVVRSTDVRQQETVKISELAAYLKKLSR